MMKGDLTGNEQDVCIVFDRQGNYVKTFEVRDIDIGVFYAKDIHGSYLIVRPTQITERVKQAGSYKIERNGLGFDPGFYEIFAKFFPIFRGDAN